MRERERERYGIRGEEKDLGFGVWMDGCGVEGVGSHERGREGGTWDEMKEKKNQPSFKMLH